MPQSSTKVWLPYKARSFFLPFHGRTARFSVIVAHRSAGKTEACLNELIARALKTKKPYARYAYIGPTYVQAINVAWERLKRLLPPELLEKCNVKESNHSITFPNGVAIQVFGADKYDSLRGLRLDGLIMDEVAQMHPDAWPLVILPCLTQQLGRNGWAVFIGTPQGTSNFFYEQREKARKNETGDWFYLELKASLTKFLSDDVLQQARENMDEDEYLQEYECSFVAANKGSYYGKLIVDMENEGRTEPFTHVKAAPVHLAFDLGWSDETTAWFYQIIGGRLDIIDYYHVSGKSALDIIDDLCEHFKANNYRPGDWWLPHDANKTEFGIGKTVVEQMRAYLLEPQNRFLSQVQLRPVPELRKQQGRQAVRKLLPLCRINGNTCYDGIEALKSYRKKFNDKLGTYSDDDVHDWASHGADAFRYLAIAVSDQDLEASIPKENKSAVNQDLSLEEIGQLAVNSPKVLTKAGLSHEEIQWMKQLTRRKANVYIRI